MRATAVILFIAGLSSTAWGASTRMYSDENCQNQIDRKVFNGITTGDAPIRGGVKAIKTDSSSGAWFAYQRNDGTRCTGSRIGKVENNKCIRISDQGIGCTRLCSGALGC
ncbi:uncharacterized protein B0T15DRAFT_439477 [Chaetomium strumarium]|uniref:Uncharacterized protein n=1 Tax=Chaetomium strumarium TaxID=1170767 RepID=A0AAJ0LZS5_9PEZI|nr:hypothetical protein B0T15DRAFT_439477 [Chaetomium strumarium]